MNPSDILFTDHHRKQAELSTTTEMLETGIKVIDLIQPVVRGGKVGFFGGAGVGKTVLVAELIYNYRDTTRGLFRLLWCW